MELATGFRGERGGTSRESHGLDTSSHVTIVNIE